MGATGAEVEQCLDATDTAPPLAGGVESILVVPRLQSYRDHDAARGPVHSEQPGRSPVDAAAQILPQDRRYWVVRRPPGPRAILGGPGLRMNYDGSFSWANALGTALTSAISRALTTSGFPCAKLLRISRRA